MPAPGVPRAWRDVVDAIYGDDIEKFHEHGIDSVLDESATSCTANGGSMAKSSATTEPPASCCEWPGWFENRTATRR